ncbi:hypothetical protein C0J52_08399 [Blattella germanica]|nr:hypothetical protein C0J52_08399 [Blattella germanica]
MATTTSVLSELPTERMQILLKTILKDKNLDSNTTTCIIKQVDTGNWVSSVYFIEVHDSTTKISLYLKCLPEGKCKDKGDFLNSRIHFENEVIFYSKVLPAFEHFQNEILPTEIRPTISVPYCYGAEADEHNCFIMMENLSSKGFIVLDRLVFMSIPEISFVLKDLGRYHAFSLAMKVLQPENFRKLRDQIRLTLFNEDDYVLSTRAIFSNALQDVLDVMKLNYAAESSYLRKYENFIEPGMELFPVQGICDPENEPFNVITHGDLWLLNVMFHYGAGCKYPDGIRFIDLQQMRYTSPATDIGRLLFVSLDRTTRYNHRNDLLQCYYNSLSSTLQSLGLNVEFLFPFSQLETQLIKYATFYTINSILNVIHSSDEFEGSSDEFTGDFKEDMLNLIRAPQKRMTPKCMKRVFDIIEECADRELNLDPNSVTCNINQIQAGRWVSSMFFVEAYNDHKRITLYLKCLPIYRKCDFLASKDNFQNEVTFYTKVVPEFKKFRHEKFPLETSSPILLPECYRAEADGINDVIILENLSESGFIVRGRLEGMTIPEISLAFKELGKFHAYSLAMKIQYPQRFNELKNHLDEPVFNPTQYENITKVIYSNCWEDVCSALKQHYKEGSVYLKKVEEFIKVVSDRMFTQAICNPSNEPYNAIIHGDPWVSNFMFKYKDSSEEPADIRILDFQQVRYNSPALDIGRMLFVCMDKATRDIQRNNMLLCYYNSLSQTLMDLGSNPEYLFPFSELEIQLKKYSAFFVSVSLLTIIHALDENEIDDEGFVGEDKESLINSIRAPTQRMTAKCRQRVVEIIEESVQLGYIDLES